MTAPILSTRNSGHKGRGYVVLDEKGGHRVVPSVTTVLDVLDKPGVTQWAVDNTVAYAVANVDALLERSDEQGFKMLRFYHSRMNSAKFDDGDLDVNNYHTGVLNDLAELGTITHSAVQAAASGGFLPDFTREEQVQMVNAFFEFQDQNEIEVVANELTVYGRFSAGTLDGIWKINGVPTLLDIKTSSAIRDSHLAQLAAYSASETAAVEVPEGTEGAIEYEYTRDKQKRKAWFKMTTVPAFSQHAILQLRPDEYLPSGAFRPAFCKLHIIPQEVIDTAYLLFESALNASVSRKLLEDALKEFPIEA